MLLLSLSLPLQGLAGTLSPQCAHHASQTAPAASALAAGHCDHQHHAGHPAHQHPSVSDSAVGDPSGSCPSAGDRSVDGQAVGDPSAGGQSIGAQSINAQSINDSGAPACDHCQPCHLGANLLPAPPLNAAAMPPESFGAAAANPRLPQVFIDGPHRPPRATLA
jgi:hypothetical protein